MLPLFLLAALITLAGGLSARFLTSAQDSVFLRVILILFIVAFGIAIFALSVLCAIYMIKRFYDGVAGREAYLSLNLPISVDGHICSKLISATVWSLLTFIVTFALIALFFFVAAGSRPFEALAEVYRELMAQITAAGLSAGQIAGMAVKIALAVLIQLPASYLMVYTAIAIGQQSTEKKLGSSIAAFAVISVIISMAHSLLMVGVLNYTTDSTYIDEQILMSYGPVKFANSMLIATAVVNLIEGAVFYIISSGMLKKRLNLS